MKRLYLTTCFIILFGKLLLGQEDHNHQLRFDGIYVTKPYNDKNVDSLIGLLRFYEEGIVINGVMWPDEKNWTPDSLETFNKEYIQADYPKYRPIGKYDIMDNKISFNIENKMTKLIFNGYIINRETLEITIYSKRNKNKLKQIYYFMPYKN